MRTLDRHRQHCQRFWDDVGGKLSWLEQRHLASLLENEPDLFDCGQELEKLLGGAPADELFYCKRQFWFDVCLPRWQTIVAASQRLQGDERTTAWMARLFFERLPRCSVCLCQPVELAQAAARLQEERTRAATAANHRAVPERLPSGKDLADDDAILAALDRSDPDARNGVGLGELRSAALLGRDRAEAALRRLVAQGKIEPCQVSILCGNGASRKSAGVRRTRPAQPAEDDEPAGAEDEDDTDQEYNRP
jgi:hypothetical protein